MLGSRALPYTENNAFLFPCVLWGICTRRRTLGLIPREDPPFCICFPIPIKRLIYVQEGSCTGEWFILVSSLGVCEGSCIGECSYSWVLLRFGNTLGFMASGGPPLRRTHLYRTSHTTFLKKVLVKKEEKKGNLKKPNNKAFPWNLLLICTWELVNQVFSTPRLGRYRGALAGLVSWLCLEGKQSKAKQSKAKRWLVSWVVGELTNTAHCLLSSFFFSSPPPPFPSPVLFCT